MSSQFSSNRSKILKLLVLAGILVAIIGGSVVAITFKTSTVFLSSEGVILQKSKNDCGVAATKNIVKHFGYEPNSVDTLLKVTANAGVNLLDIKNALKSYNLAGRGFKTTIQEINTLPLPMIAHWEGNHFVVVETVHDNDITVIDPAMGRVRYAKSRFAEHWTGVVLSVEPAPKQQ